MKPFTGLLVGITLLAPVALQAPFAAAQGNSANGVKIDISTEGNALSFDKKALHVKPGQQVELTFHNAADAGSGMKHTWVLVKPGTEDQVASEAVAAGAGKSYIPDDANIIAHTGLIKAGQSETIRFTAPKEGGKYPFLCTFPAHSSLLKGTLEVG